MATATATGRGTKDSARIVPIALIGADGDDRPLAPDDPATVVTTCANCGARMIERKCKLICTCGYFLSCSDYY